MLATGIDRDTLNHLAGILQRESDVAIGGHGECAHEFVASDVAHLYMHFAGNIFQTDGTLTIAVGDADDTFTAHGCPDEGFVSALARDGELHRGARL